MYLFGRAVKNASCVCEGILRKYMDKASPLISQETLSQLGALAKSERLSLDEYIRLLIEKNIASRSTVEDTIISEERLATPRVGQ